MPDSVFFFEVPHFTVWNVLYTGIGAAIFWNRWGRTKLRVFVLAGIVEWICEKDSKEAGALEFVVFIILGCLVGVGVAEPQNVPQSLAAGMGWTGFLATNKTEEDRHVETSV